MSDSIERRQFRPEWSGETHTNAEGGRQQKLNYRFDLIDPHAIYKLAKVLSKGAEKYGEDNWRKIPAKDHVNHCLEHLYAWLAGDKSEDHIGHALTRAMFAAAVEGLDGPSDPAPTVQERMLDPFVVKCMLAQMQEAKLAEPLRVCSECRSYAALLKDPTRGICDVGNDRVSGTGWCADWRERKKGA